MKKFHQTTLLTYSFHFTNKPFLKVSKHAVSKIQFLRKKTFFFGIFIVKLGDLWRTFKKSWSFTVGLVSYK
ncbi:hypothetical protein Z972_07000 [Enterococcus faecium VSE1036]|nr:hypothetical protein Z972_07000 [Enterococcus faecium VSE1036]